MESAIYPYWKKLNGPFFLYMSQFYLAYASIDPIRAHTLTTIKQPCMNTDLMDGCLDSPCVNNGTCMKLGLDSVCLCPPFTSGFNCELSKLSIISDHSMCTHNLYESEWCQCYKTRLYHICVHTFKAFSSLQTTHIIVIKDVASCTCRLVLEVDAWPELHAQISMGGGMKLLSPDTTVWNHQG